MLYLQHELLKRLWNILFLFIFGYDIEWRLYESFTIEWRLYKGFTIELYPVRNISSFLKFR